jgi:iron complex outermembrane recepter protein
MFAESLQRSTNEWRRSHSRPLTTAVGAVLALAASSLAHAQELVAANNDASAGTLDTVVVLGTSRDDTTALTSTAPVDVITPEQLQQTGAVSINQALSKLHPSFNFPQGQNAVKGQGVRAVSLRGVGPAYTLVLVNGKRRNVSAQLTGTDPWPAAQVVDVNVIPVSAVERVEVLRDGAAAQYGSDAIAGVINIVLKRDDSGSDINARVGEYTDNGGRTYHIAATSGISLGERGFLNINVDRLKNDQVDRSEADWRQLFPNGDPRNETFNKKYGQWGQSSRDNWAALINAQFDFSDAVSAYGWVNYADKSANNYVNPERVVKANTQSATATNGARVSETAVPGIYPTGYQPNMTYAARDWAGVAGLKFSNEALGDFDFAVSHGRNETDRSTYSTINPSYGPQSPTSFDLGSWKSRTTSGTLDYVRDLPLSFVSSAVLSAGTLYRHEYWGTGDFGAALGYTSGPLAGRTVASLYGPGGIYNQYAAQFPGVNFATDTSVVPATGSSTVGVQPIDAGSATRNIYGGYVGIDAALTPKLDVGITGRYEHYSDFGSTNNYRLTARYEIIPAIAVRGTVSSGFHAPSLAALGLQSTGYTSTFTNNGTSVLQPGRTRQFRSNDPTAAAFGAKPLQPEESTTYSLGVVFNLDSTASLTIDAYRLNIEDVITNTDPIQGASVIAAFNAAGLNGYTQTSYYLNAWDARTNGVDLVGRKQLDLLGGTLELTAATSFLDTEVSAVNRQINVGGTVITVIGNARIRDAESGVPKNKIILSGRYDRGPWTIDATGTRYSSYRYNVGIDPGVATANGNIDQEFSPETYLDLGVSYQALEFLRVDLLVQNVFNDYPDKYVNGNRSSGINPYSFIAPNGASGRFIQAGLNWTF